MLTGEEQNKKYKNGFHKFPFLISLTAWSAARAARAIKVNDGFWQADEVMHAPSVTYTFFESQTWLKPFRTEVFGSLPIRAVPISWMALPGAVGYSPAFTFLRPAASNSSIESLSISLCIRF